MTASESDPTNTANDPDSGTSTPEVNPGKTDLQSEGSAPVVGPGHSSPSGTESQSFAIALLRLMRIPNVFTAIADILMGFIFIHQSFEPLGGLLCLLLATVCLYSAGMVLNDVFDVDVDTLERPERPIPSGAISLRTASLWGCGLLTSGFLFASGSFVLFGPKESPLWIGFEPGLVSLLLIGAILLYDKVLKKTALAPVMMGSCRTLNILLGMSLASADDRVLLPAGALLALGMGIFIAGVTWFARSEARGESDQKLLTFGFVVMFLGLGTIALVPFSGLVLPPTVNPQNPYLLLFMVGVIGLSIGRLSLTAILDPVPRHVQATIKQCILSLILIHAAICLWVDRSNVQFPLVVAILIFPALLLGRWFKST